MGDISDECFVIFFGYIGFDKFLIVLILNVDEMKRRWNEWLYNKFWRI